MYTHTPEARRVDAQQRREQSMYIPNRRKDPVLENRSQTTTAQQDAVARAVEANRRLLDAATKAGSAVFEACQETVLGMPGVPTNIAAAAPSDRSKFMAQPGFPGNDQLSETWQRALGGAFDPDELVAAGKRVCLDWVDSYEQAALAAIDLRERVAEATNLEWMQQMASTSAGVRRDITKAYVSSLRGFLK
jgi:hypothetical protein